MFENNSLMFFRFSSHKFSASFVAQDSQQSQGSQLFQLAQQQASELVSVSADMRMHACAVHVKRLNFLK
jgi:hypothetical protein